jgi:hypothetical protein
MSDTLINVSVPYVVEFVRRKCRNVESGIFWEDGSVAIRTVTAEQAPVACRVRPGENSFTPEFSVRSFDGRFWWPLFDGPGPMRVRNYVASAKKSDGLFLSMMNLSPATVYSLPRRNAEQFFNEIIPRWEDGSSMERWRSACSIAHRTLFCDDMVYLAGGCPVYFGVTCGTADDRMLSLEVGSAAVERVDVVSRYLPGPRPMERRDAACRSFVYGIEGIGDEVAKLQRRGFQVTFESRAEVRAELRSDTDPSVICADALVRRAVTVMDPHSFNELGTLLQGRLQPAASLPLKLPLALCRDAVEAMILICRPDDFPQRFGFEFEWVAEALSRLDAHAPMQLSELEDQFLVDYFASPSIAEVVAGSSSSCVDYNDLTPTTREG